MKGKFIIAKRIGKSKINKRFVQETNLMSYKKALNYVKNMQKEYGDEIHFVITHKENLN
jgi:hypothetical protein